MKRAANSKMNSFVYDGNCSPEEIDELASRYERLTRGTNSQVSLDRAVQTQGTYSQNDSVLMQMQLQHNHQMAQLNPSTSLVQGSTMRSPVSSDANSVNAQAENGRWQSQTAHDRFRNGVINMNINAPVEHQLQGSSISHSRSTHQGTLKRSWQMINGYQSAGAAGNVLNQQTHGVGNNNSLADVAYMNNIHFPSLTIPVHLSRTIPTSHQHYTDELHRRQEELANRAEKGFQTPQKKSKQNYVEAETQTGISVKFNLSKLSAQIKNKDAHNRSSPTSQASIPTIVAANGISNDNESDHSSIDESVSPIHKELKPKQDAPKFYPTTKVKIDVAKRTTADIIQSNLFGFIQSFSTQEKSITMVPKDYSVAYMVHRDSEESPIELFKMALTGKRRKFSFDTMDKCMLVYNTIFANKLAFIQLRSTVVDAPGDIKVQLEQFSCELWKAADFASFQEIVVSALSAHQKEIDVQDDEEAKNMCLVRVPISWDVREQCIQIDTNLLLTLFSSDADTKPAYLYFIVKAFTENVDIRGQTAASMNLRSSKKMRCTLGVIFDSKIMVDMSSPTRRDFIEHACLLSVMFEDQIKDMMKTYSKLGRKYQEKVSFVQMDSAEFKQLSINLKVELPKAKFVPLPNEAPKKRKIISFPNSDPSFLVEGVSSELNELPVISKSMVSNTPQRTKRVKSSVDNRSALITDGGTNERIYEPKIVPAAKAGTIEDGSLIKGRWKASSHSTPTRKVEKKRKKKFAKKERSKASNDLTETGSVMNSEFDENEELKNHVKHKDRARMKHLTSDLRQSFVHGTRPVYDVLNPKLRCFLWDDQTETKFHPRVIELEPLAELDAQLIWNPADSTSRVSFVEPRRLSQPGVNNLFARLPPLILRPEPTAFKIGARTLSHLAYSVRNAFFKHPFPAVKIALNPGRDICGGGYLNKANAWKDFLDAPADDLSNSAADVLEGLVDDLCVGDEVGSVSEIKVISVMEEVNPWLTSSLAFISFHFNLKFDEENKILGLMPFKLNVETQVNKFETLRQLRKSPVKVTLNMKKTNDHVFEDDQTLQKSFVSFLLEQYKSPAEFPNANIMCLLFQRFRKQHAKLWESNNYTKLDLFINHDCWESKVSLPANQWMRNQLQALISVIEAHVVEVFETWAMHSICTRVMEISKLSLERAARTLNSVHGWKINLRNHQRNYEHLKNDHANISEQYKAFWEFACTEESRSTVSNSLMKLIDSDTTSNFLYSILDRVKSYESNLKEICTKHKRDKQTLIDFDVQRVCSGMTRAVEAFNDGHETPELRQLVDATAALSNPNTLVVSMEHSLNDVCKVLDSVIDILSGAESGASKTSQLNCSSMIIEEKMDSMLSSIELGQTCSSSFANPMTRAVSLTSMKSRTSMKRLSLAKLYKLFANQSSFNMINRSLISGTSSLVKSIRLPVNANESAFLLTDIRDCFVYGVVLVDAVEKKILSRAESRKVCSNPFITAEHNRTRVYDWCFDPALGVPKDYIPRECDKICIHGGVTVYKVGVRSFLHIFTQDEFKSIESDVDLLYEQSQNSYAFRRHLEGASGVCHRDLGDKYFNENTAHHVFNRAKCTRTKMFFNFRYLWTRDELKGKEARRAQGIRDDPSRIPKWMRFVVQKRLEERGILKQRLEPGSDPVQNALFEVVDRVENNEAVDRLGVSPIEMNVNSFAVNIYHDGSTGLSQHFDDAKRFKSTIVSMRLFSDSRLSFGCKLFGFCNGTFTVDMPRGSLQVLDNDSYAGRVVKHCIRPNDMSGKSGVLLLREIQSDVAMQAREISLTNATNMLRNLNFNFDKPVLQLAPEKCQKIRG